MGRKFERKTRRQIAADSREENKQRLHMYAEYDEPTPRQQEVPKLEPKNIRQKNAVGYLSTNTDVVILSGSAGTGKSMIAAHRAATLLRGKRIDKVWLARPAVGVGKSIGLLPGDPKEKLTPYFRQTLKHLEKFLGKGYLNYCLEKGVIEMTPMEYLRGMSFEDCFVLVEESQNMTHEDFEMMLTRMGENAQVCFTGDTKQNDLRQESGLKTTIEFVSRLLQTHPEYMKPEDMDALDDGIGIVQFQPEDVVRGNGLTRALVRAYYHAP